MRFYNQQHQYYCGIDLHVKTMYVCIVDAGGQALVHRNVPSTPTAFLEVVGPYGTDLVVAAECMFTWYWLADVCAAEGIRFVLGHALAMKAIHGGKAKNDKIDSYKIAVLLRGGLLPQAYVYPAAMRATRDLIRRRLHLVRKRGQLLAHIQNTRAQYNLPAFGRKLADKANRDGVVERFADPSVQKSIEVDLALIDDPLRDPRHHALRSGAGIRLLRAIDQMHPGVRRPETRDRRREDGERPSEVGLLGGRGDLPAPQSRRAADAGPPQEETRQRQGAVDPRAQNWASGLLHALARHTLLDGEVPRGVAGKGAGEPDA